MLQRKSRGRGRPRRPRRVWPRRQPSYRDLILHIGTRSFEGGFVGSQGALSDAFFAGLEFTNTINGPFGYEVGLFLSDSNDDSGLVDYDLTVVEIMLGGRYTHGLGKSGIDFVMGAGLDFALTEFEQSGGVSIGSTDFSIGPYAHGGLEYRYTKSLLFGVQVRRTWLTEVDGVDIDHLGVAGYIGIGL